MSKLSIILQIIKKSIFRPRLMLELAEEKSEINDDQKFRNHEYEFDFENIDDFFKFCRRRKKAHTFKTKKLLFINYF